MSLTRMGKFSANQHIKNLVKDVVRDIDTQEQEDFERIQKILKYLWCAINKFKFDPQKSESVDKVSYFRKRIRACELEISVLNTVINRELFAKQPNKNARLQETCDMVQNQVYIIRAMLCERLGKSEKALTLYSNAIQAFPHIAKSYLYKAQYLRQLGQENECQAIVKELALQPNLVFSGNDDECLRQLKCLDNNLTPR